MTAFLIATAWVGWMTIVDYALSGRWWWDLDRYRQSRGKHERRR